MSTGLPGRTAALQFPRIRRRQQLPCRAATELGLEAAESADEAGEGVAPDEGSRDQPEPLEEQTESDEDGESIYIGFDKGDYDRSVGRRGRVIKDDSSRYPERSVLTGGWSGGEGGLRKFLEAAEASSPATEGNAVGKQVADTGPGMRRVKYQGKEVTARDMGDGGRDAIYIGFDKSAPELERRKAGGAGKFVLDDDRKYPQKETLGAFTGVVGGFKGGELGVKQFVEVGDIKLAEKSGRQQSTLLVAGIVAAAGTLGGLFLFQAEEVGEEAVEAVGGANPQRLLEQSESALSSLDGTTRLALQVALGLATVGGLYFGGRAVVKNLASSVAKGAATGATLLVFWTAVAYAFKFVIEN